MRIALVGQYPEHTFEKLRAFLPRDTFDLVVIDNEEAYQQMTDAQIIILRIFKAQKEMMERNPELKMILRWGTGFEKVDIEAAGERGIIVTNTPGANANAVSELAVLLMLAVGRKLLCHTESLNGGVWSTNTYINSSYCLHNKLVGIVGGGNIGREVARKAHAFGAQVQYYDPYRLAKETENKLNMQYVSMETLLKTSDIISLHVPVTDSNFHMIGKLQFDQMKKGAILINTARGALVDNEALLEAVNDGRLLGAGLDVVDNAPLPIGDRMLLNPNIIITPHIGGGTADIGDVIIMILVQDILAFSKGVVPEHVVNNRYLNKIVS
ncbi:2-hydroxyacid dehydrogenase [Fusibacter paucivorans]|uniref:2-hydroxyacid dehydrogenase n=1 Tax=Fusibacter paucivorans TaxID=76009 RepID=A0ABS5PR34_9FIRM|nr:2-hydroxyacid dehydrogenase [Fusibacter paucivorans]MBS7527600.1 2-hydroxyacid dehydrogenase [Fusibacter paucivorans]